MSAAEVVVPTAAFLPDLEAGLGRFGETVLREFV